MNRIIALLSAFLLAWNTQAGTITMADPTIFYDNGYFYLTGTWRVGSGFNMYRSTDLIHWTACGNAAGGLALAKADTYGEGNFWAPQIFKHGDKYYFAYAADEQIGIAESNSPMGPFKQSNIHCLKNTTKQIDPFLFRDDDGTVYMYYVRLDGSNSLYVAKMKDDLSDLAEDPTFCLRASDGTWEHTCNYTTYKVTEGPTVIKDGGYYFLLYSCNDFHDIDYSVGYAYSKSAKGPWTKVGKPFLSRHNTGMNGSGHGDLFQDADGQWYYVFHVHASNTDVGNRRTAVVPITMTDNVKNKFVPDATRVILLSDNASSTTTFPSASTDFEVDGIHYRPTASTYVEVTFGNPVNFGDYSGDVNIPSSVKNKGKTYRVTGIGSGAFHNCTRLSSVTLPTTVTKVSDYAFEGSSLRDITMPSGCKTIGMRAFALCDKIKDIQLKQTILPTLGNDAFTATTFSKAKLWVPSARSSAYSKADGWKNFTHISGKEETGSPAYNMKVGSSFYTRLDNSRCALSPETSYYYSYFGPDMVIGDTLEYEGVRYAVTQLAKNALRECHWVQSAVLDSPVDTIQGYGLYNCYRLKWVELPSTLKYIAGSAFSGCSVLDSIICHATVPPVVASKTSIPTATYTSGVLMVPEGTKAAYAADAVWGNFARIEEMKTSSISLAPTTGHPSLPNQLYTLDGRYAGTATHHLRPGLYVSQGKKVIIP